MNSTVNVDVLLSNALEGLSERKEHRCEVEFVPEPPFPREVFLTYQARAIIGVFSALTQPRNF